MPKRGVGVCGLLVVRVQVFREKSENPFIFKCKLQNLIKIWTHQQTTIKHMSNACDFVNIFEYEHGRHIP